MWIHCVIKEIRSAVYAVLNGCKPNVGTLLLLVGVSKGIFGAQVRPVWKPEFSQVAVVDQQGTPQTPLNTSLRQHSYWTSTYSWNQNYHHETAWPRFNHESPWSGFLHPCIRIVEYLSIYNSVLKAMLRNEWWCISMVRIARILSFYCVWLRHE